MRAKIVFFWGGWVGGTMSFVFRKVENADGFRIYRDFTLDQVDWFTSSRTEPAILFVKIVSTGRLEKQF